MLGGDGSVASGKAVSVSILPDPTVVVLDSRLVRARVGKARLARFRVDAISAQLAIRDLQGILRAARARIAQLEAVLMRECSDGDSGSDEMST